ncbi:Uncharacterised protein [uncultured archaeon]|nr:Uncharacterised protein [uncultured archaeon]
MTPYDSTIDTLKHRELVVYYIHLIIDELMTRAELHDLSKLSPEEKPLFDEFTPKLKATPYGSPEYHENVARLGEALKHHYAVNRHHVEHFPDGVKGMNLVDLIEMICDWKASTYRQQGGNLLRSIDLNTDRLQHSDQLVTIFENTAKEILERNPQ